MLQRVSPYFNHEIYVNDGLLVGLPLYCVLLKVPMSITAHLADLWLTIK